MKDLLNIELVTDNLKKFDKAWLKFLMALEKKPEDDLLDGFYLRQSGSRLPSRMPWRYIVPIRFTAKSRRATSN